MQIKRTVGSIIVLGAGLFNELCDFRGHCGVVDLGRRLLALLKVQVSTDGGTKTKSDVQASVGLARTAGRRGRLGNARRDGERAGCFNAK
jgi:hypothetical protein